MDSEVQSKHGRRPLKHLLKTAKHSHQKYTEEKNRQKNQIRAKILDDFWWL